MRKSTFQTTRANRRLAFQDDCQKVENYAYLNFGLDVFDGVRRLDLEGDGLSRQSLDENLHSSSESKDQVKGRLLLDVVVGQSAAVLQLLASEDETLLIGRDSYGNRWEKNIRKQPRITVEPRKLCTESSKI